MTETFTLTDADADACAATVAHASALPPRLVTSLTTALPVDTRFVAPSATRLPCVLKTSMIAGRFVWIVVTSIVRSLDAVPTTSRETVGGVHVAVSSASLEQLAWQFASPMHIGGVSFPSQVGAV